MKRYVAKSLLSVVLSLMMIIVFIPATSYADETDITEQEVTTEPVAEPDCIDNTIEASEEVVQLEEDQAAEEVPKAGAENGVISRPAIESDFIEKTAGSSSKKGEPGLLKSNRGKEIRSTKAYPYGTMYVNSVSKPSMIFKGKISECGFKRPSSINSIQGRWHREKLKKGVLGVHAFMDANGNSFAGARIGLFYDQNARNPVDTIMYVNEMECYQHEADSIGYFNIPKDGTYYLIVYALYSSDAYEDDWSDATHMDIKFIANRYAKASAGTTLKANKVYGVRCNAKTTRTYKYKAAKTGSLLVCSDDATKTTLKKSSGKKLGAQAEREYNPTFGVKKKTRYKLSVNTPSYTYNHGYFIYVKNTKVKNQSGSSKSKAAKLKKGHTKKALEIAGKTKTQWFKFKNPKKRNFSITVNGGTHNKFRFEFYKGSTKLKRWTDYFTIADEGYTLTTLQKMPKGTYYIKVTPVKKSSGWYSFKWK